MKKTLLMLALCLSAIFMTSCEEIVKKTYYMSPSDMSVNCVANLYIQGAIHQEIYDENNMPITFFGEEKDAIAWFDKRCQELVDPAFTADYHILGETWMDMNLLDLGGNNRVVKTTRLVFTEKEY